MAIRYLEADKVTLPASAPQFVEPGHCQWCNKPLTGKATKYCRITSDSLYSNISDCAAHFLIWWCSRPAYVRATFIRDNFTCQECGYHKMMDNRPWLPDMSNLECDHIIPLARGGETTMDNLQTLCQKCNRQKGIKVADDLEQELPRVIPSRDNSRCPSCGAHGYTIVPWEVPEYYDPLMYKVRCNRCREDSYIVPPGRTRRRALSASRR
ncbi:hypothetical protein ES703_107277 [subsurface metagenome]